MDKPDDDITHFGYQRVPVQEKARRVANVFNSVADKYDVMNDLMSLGVHRLWKRFAIGMTGVGPGQRVLDVASGTGDLARAMAQRVGESGEVVMTDINAAMLARGRARLTDEGIVGNVRHVLADAQRLPFPDNYFDCVTMGFGLRNVTNIPLALASMHSVLRPGGRLIVLEFSRPALPGLKPLYDAYSFQVLPRLGKLIAGDAESYRYLAESIRMHPGQERLRTLIRDAGFAQCDYYNLSGGIVALHRGYKL